MWWKIYFWIICCILIFDITALFSDKIINIYLFIIDILNTVILLIGLYAYVFKKRIFSRTFWEFFLWINIVYFLLESLYILAPENPFIKYLSYLQSTKLSDELLFAGLLQRVFSIAFSAAFLLPLVFSIYQLSQGKYREIKKTSSKIVQDAKIINLKKIEFIANYTIDDFYEGLKIEYQSYQNLRTKLIIKAFGIYLVTIYTILLASTLHVINVIVLITGVFFIILPLKVLYKFLVVMHYWSMKLFNIPTKITIDEKGVTEKNKIPFFNHSKWNQFNKIFHNDKILVLRKTIDFIPFIYSYLHTKKIFKRKRMEECY
jgi:hypothetical protein